jgi:hypothetical protein
MGLFNRRKQSGPTQVETLIFDERDCTELVAAVGESHYQDALRSLCGNQRWEDVQFDCTAVLVPQPTNPHDPNAVMVQVDATLVGYLSRGDAINYQALIREATPRLIHCEARIAGRGPGADTSNLGVFLRLPPPDHKIEVD